MRDLVFIEEAPMQGLERPASPGVTIGRAECDVDLNDPDVSRRHAVVRRSTRDWPSRISARSTARS